MTRLHVRPATAEDLAAIDAIHRAAFPTDLEARLVALLIARGKAAITLVAELDGQIAGHILFSPATWEGEAPAEPRLSGSFALPGLGLAPLAVLPAFQNQGIGSALVRAGLVECRHLANVRPAGPAGPELLTDTAPAEVGGQRSEDDKPTFNFRPPTSDLRLPTSDLRPEIHWVVVLGHPTYYPRFGFAPARRWNLTGDYGDSGAFQFLPLTAAADALRGGRIRYAPEFAEVFPGE